MDLTYEEVMASIDETQRLAVTMQVFEAIRDHMREGGTFRYLIYDRLGFDTDAYIALLSSGGMDISNFICDAQKPKEEESDE